MVPPYQVRFTSVSKTFATFATVEVGTAPSPWYGCPGQLARPSFKSINYGKV